MNLNTVYMSDYHLVNMKLLTLNFEAMIFNFWGFLLNEKNWSLKDSGNFKIPNCYTASK
jgi:hypothetical protein